MRKHSGRLAVALAIVALGGAHAAEQSFTVINVELEGSKAFLPSTLVVRKGDTVKVKVMNNLKSEPNQHGFSLPDFQIEKVVNRGEAQEIQFTADKVGVFPIKCHLHPAHLGGQLVVMPLRDGRGKR